MLKARSMIRAHKALTAINAPVTFKPDWFVISAEDNDTTMWANAETDFMHPEIVNILKANGLDYDWYDSGTAVIHKA